ncbi:MAG TPA: O-antigen ligase family protein [Gemmatimonadota bacterium]|nr:O-antigen ligase family protein [Gemmatimonadota bacterium]
MSTAPGALQGLRDPRWLGYPLAVVLGGVVVAWGVMNMRLVLAGGIGLALMLLLALYYWRRLPRIYLTILWISLLGYAFADKGFAYVGFSPLYIGEVLLLLGVLTFLLSNGFRVVRSSPLTWLYIAFAGWGLVRTIPYITSYGLVALRDAVIWGYGVFALIVAACLIRTGWLARVPNAYRRFLPWFICWVPIMLLARMTVQSITPTWPGTGVRMISVKPGDLEVHLAGVAAFILVGLYTWGRERDESSGLKEWLLWIGWLAGFMPAAMRNRGGMMAVFFALAVVLVLRPGRNWRKLVLVGTILASLALLSNLEMEFGAERELSVPQLIENIQSVFTEDVEEQRLSATRRWRLRWWETIRDDTLFGPYFWTGKGFGMSLGEDASVSVKEETRSPHNGHLTILARMGVPGAVLWLLLLGTFSVSILRAYWRARSEGQEWWARVNLWILAYWSAFLINGSFDVYLEGPQGGIWFWSVFGVGLAALEVQRRRPAPARSRLRIQNARA